MEKSRKNPILQWPYGALFTILLLGIAGALRLTWHHETLVYAKKAASIGLCPENGTISCDLVNTSTYSELWGVPIAALAIPTYFFLLGLILLRRSWSPARTMIIVMGAGTSTYSLFLAGISVWELGFACLWCVFLYGVNFSILFLGILGKKREQKEKALFYIPKLWWGFASFGLLAIVTILIQRGYRSLLIQKSQPPSVTSSIGKCLPPVILKDIQSGTDFLLQDSAHSQKPTLLIFWSSTCGHCRREMPQLVSVLKENPDLFRLVTVTKLRVTPDMNGLSHRAFTQEFAEEIKLNAPILNDPGFLANLLSVTGTPTTFILGSQGRVIHEWKGSIPELATSLKAASRSVASIAPEPCSEHIIPSQTRIDDWVLYSSTQQKTRLMSLISAPTIIVVRPQLSDLEARKNDALIKFAQQIRGKGWKLLLVTQGQPQAHDSPWPLYFTTEPTSSPGVYLVASSGALIKTFFGPLDWSNLTFQEQVYAWLANS